MKLGRRLSVGEVQDVDQHTPAEEPPAPPSNIDAAPVRLVEPPAEPLAEPLAAPAER